MSPYLSKIIYFTAYAAILALVAQKAWSVWRGFQSRNWPSVVGKIKSARIVSGTLPDDTETPGSRSSRGSEYFAVEVQYEYRVKGLIYVGTRYSFGVSHFSTYDEAIDALQGISAGREVPVYYDPARPKLAVLRMGN
jgi:hypothetical protein